MGYSHSPMFVGTLLQLGRSMLLICKQLVMVTAFHVVALPMCLRSLSACPIRACNGTCCLSCPPFRKLLEGTLQLSMSPPEASLSRIHAHCKQAASSPSCFHSRREYQLANSVPPLHHEIQRFISLVEFHQCHICLEASKAGWLPAGSCEDQPTHY